MGTSTSVAEFSHKIATAGSNLEKAQRTGLRTSAIEMKRALEAAGASMSGGDRRLSHAGRRQLTVGFDVRNADTIYMRARGPWQLVESNTSPHQIRPRRRKALRFPDGSVRRGSVRHPGTSGKHRYVAARKAMAPRVAKRMFQGDIRAVASAF